MESASPRDRKKIQAFFVAAVRIKRTINIILATTDYRASSETIRLRAEAVKNLDNAQLHSAILNALETEIKAHPAYYNALLVEMRRRGVEAVALGYKE